MRAFLAKILVAAFAVMTQLPVVHAWDMYGMPSMEHGEMTEGTHGHAHGKAEGDGTRKESHSSIFCVDGKDGDGMPTDCAKDPLPERGILGRTTETANDQEAGIKEIWLPASLSDPYGGESRELPSKCPTGPPTRGPGHSEYAAAVGVSVKKLD